MENRIRAVHLVDHRLNPAEAEIRVRVEGSGIGFQPVEVRGSGIGFQPVEVRGSGIGFQHVEVRGRLMGPRCPYASTVEIAYPFRALSEKFEYQARVLIPEPSLWDPQSPFLYYGPLELWQNGQRQDQVQVSHGLRTLQLGPQGLRVNGRLLELSGVRRDALTEAEARTLHDRGVNLLVTDIRPETMAIWDIADRYGLLMLGRLDSAEAVPEAMQLGGHASTLGWLFVEGKWSDSVGEMLPGSVELDVRGDMVVMLRGGVEKKIGRIMEE